MANSPTDLRGEHIMVVADARIIKEVKHDSWEDAIHSGITTISYRDREI